MQPKLQMDILRDIAGRIDIPLVLHGGSANPDAEIAESVTLGVGKINISSDMKYAYFQKVREILAKESWWDPNVIYPDAINAAREVIRHKMKLFGSLGKKHHCTKPEGGVTRLYATRNEICTIWGWILVGPKSPPLSWMRMAGRFAVTAARRKVDISTICLMRCGAYRAD